MTRPAIAGADHEQKGRGPDQLSTKGTSIPRALHSE
jgi:hypothetical protein